MYYNKDILLEKCLLNVNCMLFVDEDMVILKHEQQTDYEVE